MLWIYVRNFAFFAILLSLFSSPIGVYASVINSEEENIKLNNSEIINLSSAYNIIKISDTTDYPAITMSEEQILGQSFKNEDIYSRLNRLEQKLFSTNFSNDSLSDRVDRIRNLNTNETLSENNNNDNNDSDSNNVINRLFDAEINALGTSFEDESVQARLTRLEKVIFGYKQSGSIQSRINQVYKMSMSTNNRYRNETQNNKSDDYDYKSYNQPTQQNTYQAFNTPVESSSYYTNQSTPTTSYNNYSEFNNLASNSQMDSDFYNDSSPQQTTGIVDALKQIAYPFALYFLNKSKVGNYIPQDVVNQYMGNPNYYNYANQYGYQPNYNNNLTPYQRQLLQQNAYWSGSRARVIP
ncbi:MAG: hypothetical protein WCK67_10075 [bacterium]